MKRLVILVVVTICSDPVPAMHGPYAGVGVGYANTIFDVHRYRLVTAPITRQVWQSFHGIADGVQGQLVVGYVYDVNKFRLGAEMFVQMPRTTQADYGDRYYRYEFTYAYGANFIAGYYVTDCALTYFKIGAARGRFAYQDASNEGYSVLKTSFNSSGLNLGFGIEKYLTRSIGLKLEYLYTNYIPQKFISNIVEDGVAVMVENKIQPQVHTVLLGMNYHFNL